MKNMFKKINDKSLAVGLAINSMTATALSLPIVARADEATSTSISDIEVNAPSGFAENFGSLLNSILSLVLVLAALLVLAYLIWGGIEWITSGGDSGKTEKARNKITAAVIGMIILAASFAILQLVLTFLGIGTLNNLFDNVVSIN
jgi:hypothetical protein